MKFWIKMSIIILFLKYISSDKIEIPFCYKYKFVEGLKDGS